MATIPDSLAVLPDFSGDVEFVFNETVSEGGSPNMGLGTGDLEKLVILSPTEKVPKVRWKRSRVTVRPAEGWQPNRVYRVQLLPGVMDIRRNASDSNTIVTFTTGAPIPTLHLTGRIWDWTTARPARSALVVALLLPDSLRYRMLADTAGRFDFGPLPSGDYLVLGAIDQNRNFKLDGREAWDSVRQPRDSSAVPELWLFPHDTVGPATLQGRRDRFALGDPHLHPTPRPDPALHAQRRARGPPPRFRPGRSRVAAAQGRARLALPPAARRTRLDRAETGAGTGTKRPAAAGADTTPPSRAALFTTLLLRVTEPWRPAGKYVIEIDSVRNANGATARVRGPLEVPKAKVDSTAVKPDSAKAPADSALPAKPSQ